MVAIGRVPITPYKYDSLIPTIAEIRYDGYPRDRSQASQVFLTTLLTNRQDPQRQQHPTKSRRVQSRPALTHR
jgi:hypothetical protein